MPKPEITIVGHVGRNPKPDTTKAGTPIATFPVAEDHWRWDGRARQWERTGTSWFHVTCRWGLSEHVAESIETGQPVVVVGKLKIAEWHDANGVKQVTAEIDATSVGHDLRRGTAKFTKVEPAKTSAVPDDEEAEIRKKRDAPPAVPPDPWPSPANGSGAVEPPAERPTEVANAAGEGTPGGGALDDEVLGYDGDDAFPDADDNGALQPV